MTYMMQSQTSLFCFPLYSFGLVTALLLDKSLGNQHDFYVFEGVKKQSQFNH